MRSRRPFWSFVSAAAKALGNMYPGNPSRDPTLGSSPRAARFSAYYKERNLGGHLRKFGVAKRDKRLRLRKLKDNAQRLL